MNIAKERWPMRPKFLEEDVLFSRYIRDRDGWKCQNPKCQLQFEEGDSRLTCSHYFRRSIWATRFDPLNCDSLCWKCHATWEHLKHLFYKEFKIEQLGRDKWYKLTQRSNEMVKKYDAIKLVRKFLGL